MTPPCNPETAREYLRVSHDSSGRLRSVDEQHDDNERTAQAEGWTLGAPYTEAAAISASRLGGRSRPGFAALLADLRAGRFGADVLILWEPSRGSRRMSEWAAFLEALEDSGVRLHITSHGRTYDPRNARDVRSLHEDGTDSQYESAKISGRTRRAMVANAAAGRPHSRAPYGYTREYEMQGGRLVMTAQVPDPDTAPAVRLIFSGISSGRTLKWVTDELNARGFVTLHGNQWTYQRVRDLAMSWCYGGKRVHHGEVRDGTWAPLVPLDEFYRVRSILTDESHRAARPGKKKNLLTMLAPVVRCGACGDSLSVRFKADVANYRCRGGGHVQVPQAELDAYVTALIIGWLSRPNTYPGLTPSDDAAIQAARVALAEARAHHAELTGAVAQKKMSVGAFVALEPAALADIAAAERRLTDLQTPPALAVLLGDQGADVGARWAAATIAVQREVVGLIFEYVRIDRLPLRGRQVPVENRVTVAWNGENGGTA